MNNKIDFTKYDQFLKFLADFIKELPPVEQWVKMEEPAIEAMVTKMLEGRSEEVYFEYMAFHVENREEALLKHMPFDQYNYFMFMSEEKKQQRLAELEAQFGDRTGRGSRFDAVYLSTGNPEDKRGTPCWGLIGEGGLEKKDQQVLEAAGLKYQVLGFNSGISDWGAFYQEEQVKA
ncbi:hypothetical protein [Persicobacter sp. CCB-QB2]|uniref:hypothetical protein n=1 Tax=Persicobacter sp. CCB-QB2 TaxID=1561025 RepID=UPI0012F9BDAE|nr:hypothetical protein [Persicobacter sp. CCB-QB2]